ncbi:MAG: NTP transferase domain-containing protein [Patescibacteria group bacterium]|nr:NTP transferase domain-containing protein [Patescibacteria group bacterium]
MKVKVIILAAGQGKRFKSPLPKVLAQFHGQPMVAHVVSAVEKSGVTDRPVVVVGVGAEHVRAVLGDRCRYVEQVKQLGTGHAVAQCRSVLEGMADAVLVLYGDHPLMTAETVRTLVETHQREQPTLTMATTTVSDFKEWRQPFYNFGRIVRDGSGKFMRIVRIVEAKDATPEELEILEVNPSYFCFDARWLWEHLPKLTNRNAQGEYYLTDLIGIAITEGRRVITVPIPPQEALGANRPEELAAISKLRSQIPNQN